MKNSIRKMISAFVVLCMILPLSAYAENGERFTVRIVHTNDIHARVEENEKSGIIGAEKLGGMIDKFTEGADIDLVLDSGDLFHGQPIATISQGESIAELVRACGYDAMTVGNHDWSYGKERLLELCDMSDLAMLAGNVVAADTKEGFFKQEFYTESAVVGGKELKVGIFGVTDPKIKSMTAPSNVEGIEFTDPAEYANKAAKELRKEGCDIVIALTHTYAPEELASRVGGVDLWLAGHEHVLNFSEVTDSDGKVTHIVESGYYLYSLSLVEISGVIDSEGNAEDIDITVSQKQYGDLADTERKADVSAVLTEINEKQAQTLGEKIGKTPVALNGTWEDIRIFQQNIGNVVADAYILETGADVAFENAGGIRASVEQGDVTYGSIIGISPYGNYIVTKDISGAALREIMETAFEIQSKCRAANDSGEYESWPQSSGSYLQFGGMTVLYDPDKEEGNRVVSISVGGETLEADRLYTVATNNFVAESIYYPQLKDAAETGQYAACDDALKNFFTQPEVVIRKSACDERLFAVSRGKASLLTVSAQGGSVYAPDSLSAVLVAASYDGDGTLISVLPQVLKLTAGINNINADFGAFSQGGKFFLLSTK